MTAVYYLRVSGASQLDGGGYDRQSEACARLARERGLEVVETFREAAISGTKSIDDRPAFQAMVAFALEQMERPVIIIEQMDRLAREYRVQEQLLLYLASKELTLYAANTGENITESIMADPMRKALVQIQGIFAELDRSMIVAKLRKGRDRKKAAGGKVEGVYGFGTDPRKPEEPPVLAEILSMHHRGSGAEHIALMLNASNVFTRSGKPWRASTVHKIIARNKKQA